MTERLRERGRVGLREKGLSAIDKLKSRKNKMKIRSHKELDVYKMAFEVAMKIFEITKSFPIEEKYFYPVKY